MTGFRLSWEIKNPQLELFTSEVGRGVHTPEFLSISNLALKATLVIPRDISEQVGKGSLVIQVEVNTREEGGWQEEVKTSRGGEKTYMAYTYKKTWSDAEAFCQTEEGHLASILSEKEQHEFTSLVGYDNFWIGGFLQDGHWQWSDGSPWEFTDWTAGHPVGEGNCAQTMTQWIDYSCTDTIPFVCQSEVHTMKGNTNMTLEYSQENIYFPVFSVWYKRKIIGQKLPSSKDSNSSTGFRLNWFLRDSNGSRLTPQKPDMPANWKPKGAVPRYEEPSLVRMVQLANMARMQNMTPVQMNKK